MNSTVKSLVSPLNKAHRVAILLYLRFYIYFILCMGGVQVSGYLCGGQKCGEDRLQCSLLPPCGRQDELSLSPWQWASLPAEQHLYLRSTLIGPSCGFSMGPVTNSLKAYVPKV